MCATMRPRDTAIMLCLTLAVVQWSCVRPSPVHACSGLVCLPDLFLPIEGSVPANVPGLLWEPGWSWDNDGGDHTMTGESALRLRCTDGAGAVRDVAFGVEAMVLVPEDALVSGEHCEVDTTVQPPCTAETFTGAVFTGRSEFEVTEAAPLPMTLGELRADAARLRSVTLEEDAGCDRSVEVCGVRVELELDDEASPWSDLLRFETLVDGERWYRSRAANVPNVLGGSYVGRGVDVVFAATAQEPGLVAGAHTIVMRGRVPGSREWLETPPLTVVLDCPGTAPSDAGGLLDAAVGADAAVRIDAAVEAGTSGGPDASMPASTSDDGGGGSGCGCRAVGVHAGERAHAWLLAPLLALLLRRTRRWPIRRCSCSPPSSTASRSVASCCAADGPRASRAAARLLDWRALSPRARRLSTSRTTTRPDRLPCRHQRRERRRTPTWVGARVPRAPVFRDALKRRSAPPRRRSRPRPRPG
jgi:hypothetical protein